VNKKGLICSKFIGAPQFRPLLRGGVLNIDAVAIISLPTLVPYSTTILILGRNLFSSRASKLTAWYPVVPRKIQIP
jgi:hypothetical protein